MKTDIPAQVTTVLTSCGRWDLLKVTLDTFLAHHRPSRFIIVEDSADPSFARKITDAYPGIEVLLNDPRTGQHKSVDRAYQMVDTPHILHLEDDWHFLGPVDIGEAIALVDKDATITSVCFRKFDTLKLRHRFFAERFHFGRNDYARMTRAHRDWHGFSFNPGLLRREFWLEHGPYAGYPNERSLSRAMKDIGREVVFQLPGTAFHIGSGKSVPDPARAGEHRRLSGTWRRRLFGRS